MEKVELALLVLSTTLLALIILVIKQSRKGYFYRPDWETVYANTSGGYVLCRGCQCILQTTEGVREHWAAGHFDRWVSKC